MKHFRGIKDVEHISQLVEEALRLKKDPNRHDQLGKNKTIGLIFMNPSLRTRLSTQKAAMNLGMNVMVMNIDKEGWALELKDGAVMNGNTVEHIKDAAAVIGEYCDVAGIRCFPSLKNRDEDYEEILLNKFIQHAGIPVISMESSTLHPLQSFADLITITENWKAPHKPKVVLTWAPHIKALPQAVPNSFAEWMCNADVDFTITQPEDFELDEQFTTGASVVYDQRKALEGADFVYVKNWSSYKDYGKVLSGAEDWLLTKERMLSTNEGKIMHCLPVRRNVELTDELIDGPDSLILQQAENRLYAAQTVLKEILEANL